MPSLLETISAQMVEERSEGCWKAYSGNQEADVEGQPAAVEKETRNTAQVREHGSIWPARCVLQVTSQMSLLTNEKRHRWLVSETSLVKIVNCVLDRAHAWLAELRVFSRYTPICRICMKRPIDLIYTTGLRSLNGFNCTWFLDSSMYLHTVKLG